MEDDMNHCLRMKDMTIEELKQKIILLEKQNDTLKVFIILYCFFLNKLIDWETRLPLSHFLYHCVFLNHDSLGEFILFIFKLFYFSRSGRQIAA